MKSIIRLLPDLLQTLAGLQVAWPLNIFFTTDNMNLDSNGICCGSIKQNNI
jgi:hypothetical protein